MEKIRTILEMTEHPDRYSDKEWHDIFGDVEITPEQVEEDWHRVSSKLSSPNSHNIFRWAAAIATLMIVSGLTWAAIRLSHNTTPCPEAEVTPSVIAEVKTDEEQTTVIFNNVALEKMLDTIAAHYGIKVVFEDNDKRQVRIYFPWDKNQSAEDVVETLSQFQRFKIELMGETNHSSSCIIVR